jgi:hypothetical protein
MRITEKDLKEGEVICNKCDGEGVILHYIPEVMDYTCPKCQGCGKLDWIENVVGKRSFCVFFGNPDSPVDLYYSGNITLKTTKHGVLI